MNIASQLRCGRHCVFLMHCHLVFVSKYRRRVFKKITLQELQKIFVSVCRDFEVKLVEFEGEEDHVHLLVEYPPKVSISKLVNSLKGVSSRLLRSSMPEISQYYWKGVLWSPSYFAGSCGGASLDKIREYIEQQKTPKR